jgi:hypothetical protein
VTLFVRLSRLSDRWLPCYLIIRCR